MERLLTTKQAAEIFQVSERTITQKFIKEGLKFVPIGTKDYRFDLKDVLEFIEIRKEIAQEKIDFVPVKRKPSHKTLEVDFQKRKINLEQNRVV